jgi:hypothetical protein
MAYNLGNTMKIQAATSYMTSHPRKLQFSFISEIIAHFYTVPPAKIRVNICVKLPENPENIYCHCHHCSNEKKEYKRNGL